MKHRYDLTQCALYNLKSRAQLATRLGRSASFVRLRTNSHGLYSEWREPKKSGGFRTIEAPREDLKAIQRRIAELLQRVCPPEYLFSPVRGRSYMDNAAVHADALEVRLLDIEDYFGSCTAQSVYRFFQDRMKCVPDVAWTLTRLTTRNGHLPQGSPASPILSFYACGAMWAEISSAVEQASCKLTVYVDDITISGARVPERTIWAVKQTLRRNGHKHCQRKEKRHFLRTAEVTGVISGQGQLCAPHRHFKKLQLARLAALSATDPVKHQRETARARSLEAQVQALKRRKVALSSKG